MATIVEPHDLGATRPIGGSRTVYLVPRAALSVYGAAGCPRPPSDPRRSPVMPLMPPLRRLQASALPALYLPPSKRARSDERMLGPRSDILVVPGPCLPRRRTHHA